MAILIVAVTLRPQTRTPNQQIPVRREDPERRHVTQGTRQHRQQQENIRCRHEARIGAHFVQIQPSQSMQETAFSLCEDVNSYFPLSIAAQMTQLHLTQQSTTSNALINCTYTTSALGLVGSSTARTCIAAAAIGRLGHANCVYRFTRLRD